LNKYILYINEQVSSGLVYSKGYALGRLFLSLSTLSTILFNDPYRLFDISHAPTTNVTSVDICKLSLFSLSYPNNLMLAKVMACVLLAVTISGFLPRITCFLQWWLSFSVYSSAYITEGGDQINMILSLLVIPICLFDNRINQWTKPGSDIPINIYQKIVIWLVLLLIKIQVAVLYFHSGIAKIYHEQWRDGTALYYWIQNTSIGFNKVAAYILNFLFDNRFVLFFSTWSVVVFEVLLSMVHITKLNKRFFFRAALTFHILIFVCFGLFSFCFSMTGALFLYFLPTTKKT
jgi:antimicrobial peptide system SdpB family protein